MTDTPMMVPAEPEAPLERAHRAGAGLPGTALNAARTAGWVLIEDEDGNVRADSGDGELHLDFLPETDTGPLWLIRCTAHPAWQITADDNTPAEFIAAIVTAVITTGPLDPDRDQV